MCSQTAKSRTMPTSLLSPHLPPFQTFAERHSACLFFLFFFRPLSLQTIASSALVISLSIVFPVGVPSSVRLLCRTMTARLLRFSVFYLFSAQPPDVLPLCANTAEQMIIVYGQVFNMFGREYHNRDVAKLRAQGARAV